MTSTQRLFQCPKPTHRLHQFTRQDRLFIVDLDVGQILETDDLTGEILRLCPESTPDEILEDLSERYEPNLIYQAFEQLRSFEEMGFLVGDTGRETLKKKNRPRIFVASSIETWTIDCFQSTFINNAPSVLPHRVRRACDDRGADDAKYFALDFKRRELSHAPTILQHTHPLGNPLLGVL